MRGGLRTLPTPQSTSISVSEETINSAGETGRSEEHTSELQSHSDLVCRLLLEKKKNRRIVFYRPSWFRVRRLRHGRPVPAGQGDAHAPMQEADRHGGGLTQSRCLRASAPTHAN